MRRIVGSCLGARWRLLVMPVQPRRQSVCFQTKLACVLSSQGLHITTLTLIPTLLDARSDLAQSILSVWVQAAGFTKGFVI